MISPLDDDPASRTIVIALGGNALQPPGERGDIHEQFAHTRESLGAVVALAQAGWRIVLVHGNGPQIGDELLRNERARAERPPLPLGVLVAATAGWIGYMIQQSLRNALDRAGVERAVITLITQVLIDRDDPAAQTPRKPIGNTMSLEQARALAVDLGWDITPTETGWRRIVPSPLPYGVVESAQIARFLDGGTIVIACGGGGTPVYRDERLGLEGVDAVIDKDRAACILARDVGAEVLLILTNVEAAYRAYGSPSQQRLDRLSVQEARALLEAGEFGQGSMGPKIEAAVDFVTNGGGRAIIARLDRGLEAVQGTTGTTIVPA